MSPSSLLVFLGGGLLAITWIAYPIVVIAFAIAIGRRRGASSTLLTKHHPHVSLVIATNAEEVDVLARAKDLAQLAYPEGRLEIVVVDDRPGSPSYDLPARIGGVPVHIVSTGIRNGKALALNAGVHKASGEIIAFADVHQHWDKYAVDHLTAAIRGRTIAVSGQLELPTETSWPLKLYWNLERKLRHAEAAIHSAVGVTGAIWAMRRSTWTDLPPGLLLDDLFTPMRLILSGYRVDFAPDAKAFEHRVTQPAQEYQRKVRTLTGNIQLLQLLPSVLVPFRNPIWIQFAFHKLLRLMTPFFLGTLLLGGILFLCSRPVEVVLIFALMGAGLGIWVLFSPDMTARAARKGIHWALAMQAAIVVAILNGIRRRWDVWR